VQRELRGLADDRKHQQQADGDQRAAVELAGPDGGKHVADPGAAGRHRQHHHRAQQAEVGEAGHHERLGRTVAGRGQHPVVRDQ